MDRHRVAHDHGALTAPRRQRVYAALAFSLAVLPLACWMWGFWVDDALISARYAHHLASGQGYRFNAAGPSSDGVTPLGWALLLAPFARHGALAAQQAAKWLGLLAWLGGAALLGWQVAALGGARRRYLVLVLLASSASLAAWSVAGMETGVVLGLACAATTLSVRGRSRSAGVLAGLVAMLRPEAILWALLLALTSTLRRDPAQSSARRVLAFVLAGGPFVAAMLLRQLLFGSPWPLSVLAKAPVLSLGWRYALSVALLAGPVAALGVFGVPRWVRGLQLAVLGQLLAIALAGGDWMPLSRLLVVALPAVCLCSAALLSRPRWQLSLGMWALALAGQLYVAVSVGPSAAAQASRRRALMAQLAPALADAKVVAALDIGWVGAVCDASIVDMAGVTDRSIALLPGGHTSKRLPAALLDHRNVDTLVLLLERGAEPAEPWTQSHFARYSEYALAAQPQMAERYRLIAHSQGPLVYLVLRRVE